jgi:hypothetical protein
MMPLQFIRRYDSYDESQRSSQENREAETEVKPGSKKENRRAQNKRWAAVKAAKESTKPPASKKVQKEAPAKKRAVQEGSR